MILNNDVVVETNSYTSAIYKTMDIVLPPSDCSHLLCHFLLGKYTLSIENITNELMVFIN